MLDLERIFKQDRLLRATTGLNRKAFEALLPDFAAAYAQSRVKPDVVRKRAVGGGCKATLRTSQAKLFYILFYCKSWSTHRSHLATSHPRLPERFRHDRSPLITALTDNFLGAFATTTKTETTASTTNFLGAFGQTGNLEERVQGLSAEPANSPVERLPATFATQPRSLVSPLQPGC